MKVGKLVPVIVAVLALAVTPLVASADAGPKDRLSAANAGLVLTAAENFAKDADTHGGLVSKVASDWQAFLDSLNGGLKTTVEGLKKGQIMRVIARSNHDGSDESTDSNSDNNGKNDENANGGNKDNEHGKGSLNKNEHANGASVDEETSDTDTDSDTATEDTNGNSANHGKSDANKGRGQTHNNGKATGRQ